MGGSSSAAKLNAQLEQGGVMSVVQALQLKKPAPTVKTSRKAAVLMVGREEARGSAGPTSPSRVQIGHEVKSTGKEG
jgi:hypothetical protein